MRTRTRLLNLSLFVLAAGSIVLLGRTLLGLHAAGWPAHLLRPWCSVLASLFVGAGALGALRNRTWGLLLLLLASSSFAGAWAFGIAPPWFGLVTLGGLVSLGLAAAPLWKRDRAALLAAVGLALAVGTGAAALAGPGLDAMRGLMAG